MELMICLMPYHELVDYPPVPPTVTGMDVAVGADRVWIGGVLQQPRVPKGILRVLITRGPNQCLCQGHHPCTDGREHWPTTRRVIGRPFWLARPVVGAADCAFVWGMQVAALPNGYHIAHGMFRETRLWCLWRWVNDFQFRKAFETDGMDRGVISYFLDEKG